MYFTSSTSPCSCPEFTTRECSGEGERSRDSVLRSRSGPDVVGRDDVQSGRKNLFREKPSLSSPPFPSCRGDASSLPIISWKFFYSETQRIQVSNCCVPILANLRFPPFLPSFFASFGHDLLPPDRLSFPFFLFFLYSLLGLLDDKYRRGAQRSPAEITLAAAPGSEPSFDIPRR